MLSLAAFCEKALQFKGFNRLVWFASATALVRGLFPQASVRTLSGVVRPRCIRGSVRFGAAIGRAGSEPWAAIAVPGTGRVRDSSFSGVLRESSALVIEMQTHGFGPRRYRCAIGDAGCTQACVRRRCEHALDHAEILPVLFVRRSVVVRSPHRMARVCRPRR